MSEKNNFDFVPVPSGGKLESAELLLEALGKIEDRFIAEAENITPARRRAGLPQRVLIIAATILLSVGILVSSVMAASFIGGILANKNGEEPSLNDMTERYSSIEEQMLALRKSTEGKKTDAENISFSDGYAKIIWKYADEEEYRACNIKGEDAQELAQLLSGRKGFEEIDKSEEAEETCELEGIWINFGDGYVHSPCLKETKGNVGYGEVFEYEPELEPTQEFIDLVRNAIKDAA